MTTPATGGARVDRPEPAAGAVQEWLAHWLTTIAARRVRLRTLSSYESLLRLHVYPSIGDVPMRALSPEDVERLLITMEREGLSAATRLRAFHVLSRALKVAAQRGYVDRNVATLVDPPALRRSTAPSPLTREEARLVLRAAAGRRNAARWAIALGIGLRQSEVLGLRWVDLDLEAGTLRVERGLHRVAGHGLVFEEPKSERSRRTLVLPKPLADALRAHRIVQDRERQVAHRQWQDHGLVFAQSNGRPIDRRADYQEWSRLLVAAGVRHVRLHDARHTAATLLLAEGVQARVVSDLLGHSQTKITLDVYSHVLPGMAREAAERMTVALFEDDPPPA